MDEQKPKAKLLSYHCRVLTLEERTDLKDEMRIRAALNKMTQSQYLIELLEKTDRML
jgi:hypothetical protein